MTRRGFIHCVFPDRKETAVLVDEGKYVKFGSDEEIRRITGFDEVVDLNGMHVYPGFVNADTSLLALGMRETWLDLSLFRDTESVVSKIEAWRKKEEEGWLIGFGLDLSKENILITSKQLDACSEGRPAVLFNEDFTAALVNASALEHGGLKADTACADGVIDYERGVLKDGALAAVKEAMKSLSVEEIQSCILKGAKAALSHGCTTVGSDDFLISGTDFRPVLDAYEKLSYQERLPIRVREQCRFDTEKEFASFLDDGYTFLVGNDFFMIGALRISADGSPLAHGSLFTEGNGPQDGHAVLDEDALHTWTALANRFNMPFLIEAHGDAAIDRVLSVLETEVYEGNPLKDGLAGMEYARKDQIKEILEKKYRVLLRPGLIHSHADLFVDRVSAFPLRTLYDLSAVGDGLAMHPLSPLETVTVMKERKGSDGRPVNPSEALTRQDALHLLRKGNADALFLSKDYGSFEEGQKADFTVIDPDPLTDSNARVIMTVVNGETGFER
jgi:predicted amidohydrolase YtcJ